MSDHQRQIQCLRPLSGQRLANYTTTMRGQKVDLLRRTLIGGENKISFVFPVLVITDDDYLTTTDGSNSGLDGIEHRLIGYICAFISRLLSVHTQLSIYLS